MGKIIGYAKLGRSMPLTLEKCGNLGGDVEMVAVVKELALRHPDDTFVLIGRNTGEMPQSVGLPPNVVNPWADGASTRLRAMINARGLNKPGLTSEDQFKIGDIYDELVGDWFDRFDGIVMWVGQHGTSNYPIPMVDDPTKLTKPQDAFAYYASYLLRGINRWRDADPWNREEVNLNADARNRHKMRDLKWPLRHPVLAQFNSQKTIKHHRWDEETTRGHMECWGPYATDIGNGTWRSTVYDVYSRLEVNGLRPGTPFGDLVSFNDDWSRPGHFGMFINEARAIGIRPGLKRVNILNDWVISLDPYFLHGTWSKDSGYADIIKPAPWNEYYPKLHSVRCTLTTPSSGSGWATAKPWEAFAAGTVCFFHPEYDTQDNILSDAPKGLYDWLRVLTKEELWIRVKYLNSPEGRADWLWLIDQQKRHFDNALSELRYMKMIEERIWGA